MMQKVKAMWATYYLGSQVRGNLMLARPSDCCLLVKMDLSNQMKLELVRDWVCSLIGIGHKCKLNFCRSQKC